MDKRKEHVAESSKSGMVGSSLCASPRLMVLGAGVVGLSTAIQLQQCFPKAQVTIVADKFNRDTTSDGAAGVFRPSDDKTPGIPPYLARKWLKDSWNFFDELVNSPESSEAGVFKVSGYTFFNKPKDLSLMKQIIYDVRPMTRKEVNSVCGPKFKYGYKVTTVMSECRRLLPYLMKKFENSGGEVKKHHVQTLEEFVGRCDILVNCCGLNARYVLHDQQTYASRGHLLRVKAPWLKQIIYCEDTDGTCTYIYPGCDNVVVGGTRQTHDEDTSLRDEDRVAIWCRACGIVPSLEKAEILWEWVGLRPMRKPLRIEMETMNFPSGELPVVHNYGHGGDGVSLSWGTAMHAVRLVDTIIQKARL